MSSKKPILIVNSERWSYDCYIVFEGDSIGSCIPAEWVADAYSDAYPNAAKEEGGFAWQQIEEELEEQFFDENTRVEESWPSINICRDVDGYYYYYWDDGLYIHQSEEEALALIATIQQ